MPLEPGTVLAHYTIHEQIGAGGMGEVYRATDGKLGRDVAIKMLPREVASDPDRLARFKREAQLLASLNHANIAAIYGIEEAAGSHVLVLELIGGEDLAARLKRGPVSVEEALGFASQIAEGLEEAHEQGIVHRDLKPANIKITPAGKVKILDFGLAKAFDPVTSSAGDPSLSPTLTAAATRAGVIMGTAAYMSPEQARGGSVDKRTDIWAFGCVLLEMLSGTRTFSGDTISDTLASILKSDPDWSALPADTSPALKRLLSRCLEKDRRKRLRDIGEARLAIEAMLSGTDREEAAAPAATRAASRFRALPILLAVAITAAVTAAAVRFLSPAPVARDVEKYEFALRDMILDLAHRPALSPDGRKIVYETPAGIRIRDLGNLESRLVAGSEGASQAVWSPDGATIAFHREGSIWTIPEGGGQASAIVTGLGIIDTSGDISWRDPDRIVFSDGNSGIDEVLSRGGEARSVEEPDLVEVQDLHWPHVLPGGRGILYVAHRMTTTYDTLRLRANGETKTLLQLPEQELATPIYSPTGHILFVRQTGNTGLWAVPFSLASLETTGDPFLVDREATLPSVSSDGSLLYAWKTQIINKRLVWLDRQGKVAGTLGPVMEDVQSPALSPDGRRVAVMAKENGTWAIWILDVEGESRMRLTFSAQKDWDPAWSRDGRFVIYWDGKTRAISQKPADGTGEMQRLVKKDFGDSGLPAISPDGKTMLFWTRNPETKGDLSVMPLDGDGEVKPFVATPAIEDEPRISPDGGYAAYVSDESGRRELYLTRFPSAEGKWQISTGGATDPRWDPRGGRLYFLQGVDLMEVEFSTLPAVKFGAPRKLFTVEGIEPSSYWVYRFVVSPDGQRFLFPRTIVPEGVTPTLVLVRNWLGEFAKTD